MSRNAEVLQIILQQAGKPLAGVRLLKLAYLADLYAWRVLGHPISDFQYHRYHHGPFDKAFYEARDSLIEEGLVETEETTTSEGYDCKLLHLKKKREPGPEFT